MSDLANLAPGPILGQIILPADVAIGVALQTLISIPVVELPATARGTLFTVRARLTAICTNSNSPLDVILQGFGASQATTIVTIGPGGWGGASLSFSVFLPRGTVPGAISFQSQASVAGQWTAKRLSGIANFAATFAQTERLAV